MSQQRQLLPFRFNTRQKTLKVGTLDYSLGGDKSITLPQIGYLASMVLVFVGTITYSASSTGANFAPYSIFKRIVVGLNNSAQDLVNVSGFGLFLHNSVTTKVGRPDQQTDADNYAYPTSGSSQSIVQTLEVPISVSDGNNFEAGLINLQAPEVQCQLSVQFLNALTDLGTNISTLTGTVHVYYKYYEVPNPMEVMQPPVVLHRLIEQQTPISQTGDVVYTVPRGGELMRLIHVVSLNGARSDSYDETSIRFNQSETVYKQERRFSKHLARRMYGYNLPTGVRVWDFANSYMQPEETDKRDFINTERITTLDSIVTVSSSATLGSNNNFLYSIREILQTAQPV